MIQMTYGNVSIFQIVVQQTNNNVFSTYTLYKIIS